MQKQIQVRRGLFLYKKVKTKEGKTMKKTKAKMLKLIIVILLFFAMSSIDAQNENNQWYLKINYASLDPMIKNDQWFVTDEGYHIHPRTEDYTPGLSLSVERTILKKSSFELMLLYGRPTATLGIVDQNSTLEPVYKKGYHFFAILLSPNINLFQGEKSRFYVSPVCGWGMTSEVSIAPTFGPTVTWTKSSEFIYGAKIGFKHKMKNKRFLFNAELAYLSMKASLTENQTNRELNKTFGPFGILIGFAYALK